MAVLEDQPDFAVVGAAGSAEEALALDRRGCGPMWSLLDLELGADGRRRGDPARCWRRSPGTRVLVFTAYDTDERVFGACGPGRAAIC